MTDQPPTLRDRIAEALMAWTERNANPQYATLRRSETVRQNAYSRTDAVLAVLADHDRDAARTAAKACRCPHPAGEHSVYGCADGCACEWMPKRAARQTTGQDDTKPVDPTAAIEVWARLLNAADIHVYGPEHAQWRNLTPHLQDQYRKAAAWLLPRLTIQPPPAPAVGQPAEAHDTEARPPRVQWRVEGYDADEWNPVSRTFSTSEDAHARKRVSRRYPDMPTRVVRETTTWTVEGER